MYTMQIKGLSNTQEYLKKVQVRLPAELSSLRNKLTREMSMQIFNTAPMDTGFLRRNIRVSMTRDTGTISITGVPYVLPVEYGFKRHLIPLEYIYLHHASPGARADRIEPVTGFVWVQGAPTHFIANAFKKTVDKLRPECSRTAKRIVKK